MGSGPLAPEAPADSPPCAQRLSLCGLPLSPPRLSLVALPRATHVPFLRPQGCQNDCRMGHLQGGVLGLVWGKSPSTALQGTEPGCPGRGLVSSLATQGEVDLCGDRAGGGQGAARCVCASPVRGPPCRPGSSRAQSRTWARRGSCRVPAPQPAGRESRLQEAVDRMNTSCHLGDVWTVPHTRPEVSGTGGPASPPSATLWSVPKSPGLPCSPRPRSSQDRTRQKDSWPVSHLGNAL